MKEPSEEVKEVERRYEKALDDMEKHYKDVLEQIRGEIEALPRDLPTDARNMVRKTRVLDIIDRHMKGADK